MVVPVRNEAGNIAPLVAEIAAALAGQAFEVIYVNDGSTDGTEAELQRLQAEHHGFARCGMPVRAASRRRCAPGLPRRAARSSPRSMATARTIRLIFPS